MEKNNFEVYLDKIQNLKSEGRDFCIVTLVHTVGSAPQEQGARCLITAQGHEYGTIGGGKVEARAIQEAQKLLRDPHCQNHFVEWNLQKDIGMTCGGVVKLFFEISRHIPSWDIVVFGAGHVAQELIPLLLKLNCQVSCIDSRQEWLDKLPQHTRLKTIYKSPMEKYVDVLSESAYVISVTMGHGTDLPILQQALKRNFAYLGCMGSDVKAKRIQDDLQKSGFSNEQILKLHCPIGLPFGNSTPIEIAFSIVAQLLSVRDSINSRD